MKPASITGSVASGQSKNFRNENPMNAKRLYKASLFFNEVSGGEN